MKVVIWTISAHFVLYAVIICETVDQNDWSQCYRLFDVSNRTIIKTTDSLRAGAHFLKVVKAQSRFQCTKACCEQIKCSAAIRQEKAGNDCYLFDCGTLTDFRCTFSEEHDHTSMVMTTRVTTLLAQKHPLPVSQHEMDLVQLKTKAGDKINYTHHAIPSHPVVQLVHKKDVSLVQASVTACLDSQWMCVTSKECIAIYDRCDGISQCADSSDEMNCKRVHQTQKSTTSSPINPITSDRYTRNIDPFDDSSDDMSLPAVILGLSLAILFLLFTFIAYSLNKTYRRRSKVLLHNVADSFSGCADESQYFINRYL